MKKDVSNGPFVITAGSAYLDIDAYACMVALAELLNLKGEKAIAYSDAPCNYSVCPSLIKEGRVVRELPSDFDGNKKYIIVDVSDPEFLGDSVDFDNVVEIYDHHVGFEDYWTSRIGMGAHIEFIGAAATLIFREWERAGATRKMQTSTAKLLISAILDNTLNLTSSNTTEEDRAAFSALCAHSGVGEEFRAAYFSEVQTSVEDDLQNALKNDMKSIGDNPVLPPKMFQLCVWNADEMLKKLSDIRAWFNGTDGGWMLNLIDIKHSCSYFICDDPRRRNEIERIFSVCFEEGVAKTDRPYLRKQILKHILNSTL